VQELVASLWLQYQYCTWIGQEGRGAGELPHKHSVDKHASNQRKLRCTAQVCSVAASLYVHHVVATTLLFTRR